MTEQLKQLRNEIDAVDDELLRLISTRARLAQQVGRQKSGTAYRPERESQIFFPFAAIQSGAVAR